MKTLTMLLACAILLFFFRVDIGSTEDRQTEFEAIGKMTPQELVPKAKAVLETKYPNEDWKKYHFPEFVYLKEEVTVGYEIAVKEPELLAKFPCYCFCEIMGHKNLSYCYLKGGKVPNPKVAKGGSRGFDPHSAGCNTCNSEAMMAFLWNDLGIELPKMQGAMKRIFEHK